MHRAMNVHHWLFQARIWGQYAAALGGRPYRQLLKDIYTGAPYWATFDERYVREVLRLDRETCIGRSRYALKIAKEWNKKLI
jgi:hypothetical protein